MTPVLVNRQFLVAARCVWFRRIGLGSRWSARSEARTYDLDAGDDRRIIEHLESLGDEAFAEAERRPLMSETCPGRFADGSGPARPAPELALLGHLDWTASID
jgi:hypothetical protein